MRDAVPRPDCRMHNLTEYECTARWSVYKYLYRLIYHRRDEENSRNGSKWSTIIGISLINYLKLFPIFFSNIIYIGVKFQKHFFDVKNIIQFLISTWRETERQDCVAWKLGRKLKYCSWKKEKNTSSITSFREKRSNTFVPFIRGKINIYLWNQHFSNKEREKKKRREHSWNNWTRYK